MGLVTVPPAINLKQKRNYHIREKSVKYVEDAIKEFTETIAKLENSFTENEGTNKIVEYYLKMATEIHNELTKELAELG